MQNAYVLSNINIVDRLSYGIKKKLKLLWGLIPLDIRYGKAFRNAYKFLNESQWWGEAEIQNYQMHTLKSLLKHAYKNVPYYKDVFNERGIKPDDIHDISDLKILPVLTKEIIRNNLDRLVAKNYPKSKIRYVTTGGSTGIPVGFYWEKGRTDIMEQAFIWRSWNWAGFHFGQRRVVLRGNVIEKLNQREDENYYDYDPSNNALILSSYELCEKSFPKYIDKIIKFKPVVIQGYPSSLYLFARYLKSSRKKLWDIKSIFTSSENLYPQHRDIIEETFGAKIYDHYGNTEATCVAFQCEKIENYHIIPEYGITELLDTSGNQIRKPNQIGKIVSTSLINFAMPFIRYETDDLAQYAKGYCKCGRQHKLFKNIEGRLQETFITKDNRLISMTAINMHGDVFDNVQQLQFHQKKKGEVILKILKKNDFSQKDTEKILKQLYKKIGDDLDIKLSFVDEISRTARGKYKWLIQELDVEDFISSLN